MIEELNEFKNFNLDEFEILKRATIEAKEFVGKDSGYLLINSNPIEHFENILDIDTVFAGRKWFKHTDIEEHLIDGDKMMKEFEAIERKYSSRDNL